MSRSKRTYTVVYEDGTTKSGLSYEDSYSVFLSCCRSKNSCTVRPDAAEMSINTQD